MNNAHYRLLKDKLLPDYVDAHFQVVAMFDVNIAKDYLKSKHMHTGICHSAHDNYHEVISETDWVGHFKRTFMGFWSRVPASCNYLSEVTYALEVRIAIMEELISFYEKGMTTNPEQFISHPGDTPRIY